MNGTTKGRALLLCACLLAASGCETAIASGLSERQANEILVALHESGVGGAKEQDEGRRRDSTWRVLVPSGEASRALQLLGARNLPRAAAPGFQDVFGEGSLVPTATEERGRYTAALAGELSRSIESIDGVLEARVHVALPEGRDLPFDAAPRRPRASVLIRHRDSPPPYDRPAIQALVAGAVDGLDADDVAVVGVPAVTAAARHATPLVKVGPVWVAQGSAPLLRALFSAAAVSGMLLAVAIVLLTGRTRRARRAAPAAAEAAE
jgi:type III secretion protein J